MRVAVAFSARALRDLKRADESTRRRITEALERYASTQVGEVKRLRGSSRPTWRLRVGDWRVLFARKPGEKLIEVVRVAHRSQVYRRPS
ncbi:MAG: type II toxin-antitoxin system RelE/ParE family toxin [Acidobacteria bacterium]|nr:type II toxin-antitoxin system RelE/ParE family toxin [Acidobacteriota bacterium]